MSGGAGVLDITANDVVVKVGLWNLLPGVYCHLPGQHSRVHTAAHEATNPEADVCRIRLVLFYISFLLSTHHTNQQHVSPSLNIVSTPSPVVPTEDVNTSNIQNSLIKKYSFISSQKYHNFVKQLLTVVCIKQEENSAFVGNYFQRCINPRGALVIFSFEEIVEKKQAYILIKTPQVFGSEWENTTYI